MGPAARGRSVRFHVLIDGRPVGAAHGGDVDDQGNGTVTEQRLYQLIRQPEPIADRQFEIEFLDSGVAAFAFTSLTSTIPSSWFEPTSQARPFSDRSCPNRSTGKPFSAFPPSVRLAVVVGQPSEPGPYVIRVKVPPA